MAWMSIETDGMTVGRELARCGNLLAEALSELSDYHDDDAASIPLDYLDELAADADETVPDFLRGLADEIERRQKET